MCKAVREVANMPHLDTWFSRVKRIKSLLGTPRLYGCRDSVSKQLNNKLNSVFDRFWLDQINVNKLGTDGLDHNKLWFYKTLKGSFTQETNITNIRNKCQRAWITIQDPLPLLQKDFAGTVQITELMTKNMQS